MVSVTRFPATMSLEARIAACDQAMENLRAKNQHMYDEHKAWEDYRAELVEEARGAGGQTRGAAPAPQEPTRQEAPPKDAQGEHEDPNAPGGMPAEAAETSRAGGHRNPKKDKEGAN